MLLRTVVLLFLCVSSGMCATIGHYQTQPEEEEAPHGDSAAVTDGVVADVEVAAPADTQVGDSTAAEEPAADSILGDNLSAEILAVDNTSADKLKVDATVADGATAEEPETDSNRPAGDPPAMEALTGEAVPQEQPSSTEAEEDNDIRPVQTTQSLNEPLAPEQDNSWGFSSIRYSFQTMHGYFESLVELAGGQDGVCQYRCRYGEPPQPRPGYQLPEPNGCSSSLVGFQLDLGIPAMTNCCNQLDVCYDTCGTSKEDCDSELRLCLHNICSDFKKSLGFGSKVQACESMADALHSTVGTLGCRPYMNSQRAACVCEGEERDEL
ncbi:group XIIB secretory phospholipase A2-like protein isoform X2 [Anoplopoma fimbria]|uniref:group XIIB secretory phospholipase A2-like protein isoform X2 n=1 Tax=Anoplopoma fimbria TaxID=229290 RepID=UPI0023EB772D|nr:group XIIB secretory phospholipase A2-like protein isoform X2 [Anoplopoma fimbria]